MQSEAAWVTVGMNKDVWVVGYGCTLVLLIVGACGAPQRLQARLLILVGLAFLAPVVIWGVVWLVMSWAMSGINPG